MCKKHHFHRRWILAVVLLAFLFEAWRMWIYETPEEKTIAPLYKLPFPSGEEYLCIKGRGVSFMGHHGPDFYAIDFKMPEHSVVVAARGGIVTLVKDDSNVGGWSEKYIKDANRIHIDHGDGTEAQYVHFEYKGVLVRVGDKVEQGQPIGYSGNTGASMMPHLHFCVGDKAKRETIPIAFLDIDGSRVIPKCFLSYTSNNAAPTQS